MPRSRATPDYSKVARALGDSTRLRMLLELREAGSAGLTCSCMVERFPLSQPTISHHVKTLEAAGVITVERDGQFHRLSVNEPMLSAFAALLTGAGDAAAAKSRRSPARRPSTRRKAGSS
jgi:ArsR family transcriptional regulator, arsenate/arsenite/antimonite-responsive transcriptional repressor